MLRMNLREGDVEPPVLRAPKIDAFGRDGGGRGGERKE